MRTRAMIIHASALTREHDSARASFRESLAFGVAEKVLEMFLETPTEVFFRLELVLENFERVLILLNRIIGLGKRGRAKGLQPGATLPVNSKLLLDDVFNIFHSLRYRSHSQFSMFDRQLVRPGSETAAVDPRKKYGVGPPSPPPLFTPR